MGEKGRRQTVENVSGSADVCAERVGVASLIAAVPLAINRLRNGRHTQGHGVTSAVHLSSG